MFKTILVPLAGQASDAAILESAYTLARSGNGHLDCLFVSADAAQFSNQIATDNMGVPFITPELILAMEEEDRAQKQKAQAHFEKFCKANDIAQRAEPSGTPQVTAVLIEAKGNPIDVITEHARYHDAVAFRRAPRYSSLSPAGVGNVLVGCGRPVILFPDAPVGGFGRKIAIAWKATAEAAHAVAAAMPLLKRAEKVIVFAAQEGDSSMTHSCEELASALRWHGIEAQIGLIAPGKSGAAQTLLSEAKEAGADLLLMGGYGHSRARELVFGGFTRQVLQSGSLPVMLVH